MGYTPSGYARPPKGGAPCPGRSDPVPEQRTALVHAVRTAGLSVAEAARRYRRQPQDRPQVARPASTPTPTAPLADRSRRPGRSPARTPEDVERVVLEARDRWGWGPRKLHAVLAREGRAGPAGADHRRHPPPPRPHRRRRRRPRRRRRRNGSSATPPIELWQLDFKGPLEVERRRVVPLSVLDDHSRYLLALRPCTDMTYATAQAVLWDLFGDVGLPEAAALRQRLLTARNSGVGLSAFDAWLIRLGIRPIARPALPPADPGQGRAVPRHARGASSGRGSRRDALEHFAADLEAWRPVYNAVRPHEALGDEPPVCRWRPSPRPAAGRGAGGDLPGRGGAAAGRPGRRRSAGTGRGSWSGGAWPASGCG